MRACNTTVVGPTDTSASHFRCFLLNFPPTRSLSPSLCNLTYFLRIQMTIRIASLIARFLVLFVFIFVSQPHRSSSDESVKKERTLAMIKPDGLAFNHTDRVKTIILESGFSILQETIVQLDEDRAQNFYVEHSSKSFFSSLVKYMTSGPVVVMVLEKEHAIGDWRSLIGPTDARKAKITHPQSIRALCGLDSEKNCVHGSDSPRSAEREISFFFKDWSSGGVVIEHDEL